MVAQDVVARGASAAGGLLERSSQLLALTEHIAAIRRTKCGRVVFVGGEAGVGKTALIRAFCNAQAQSLEVMSGACDPLFTPSPLGPIRDIAQVGGELAELVERGARPYEVASALIRTLRSIGPSIVIIEDVHWADEATLDVLRLVARRIETVPALLLASYRDDELDRVHPLRILLGELATSGAIARLKVGPLSEQAVAELAQPFAVDAHELYRKTGGNAFFVTEVLSAGISAASIPPTVRDAVLARAARLGQAATELLETVAVLPPHAETWAIEALAPDRVAFIDQCLVSGMLRTAPGGVAFRHELARLAIEDSLPPLRRLQLHRQALEVLGNPPVGTADLARLAHHAEAAADAEAVLRFAPAAAARASALGAHREAAAQYARALRFADGASAAQRGELSIRQSHECFLTDQLDLSVDAGWAAVEAFREQANGAREGDALRALSSHMFCIARTAEAEKVARQSLAVFEQMSMPAPIRHLAMAYGGIASLCMNADDRDGATAFGTRALELAQDAGDVEPQVFALNNLGTMELLSGDPRGRQRLERSLEMARVAGLEEHVGRAYIHIAWASSRTRSHLQVEQLVRDGIQYCTERGLDLWRRHLIAYSARFALDKAEWSRSAELARDLLRNPRIGEPREERRDWRVPTLVALVVLGLVRARRGDPDCWPLLDEAWEKAERTGVLQFMGPVAAARAEAAWLDGKPDLVAELTERTLQLAQQRGAAWIVGELACWRLRAGVREPEAEGVATPYAFELAGDWKQAAQFWQERGCPYDSALARASAHDEHALRRALAELQQLDARPAAMIVARRLRESGVLGLPRGPRQKTRSNVAQLTARQLEILTLLTQGLRNAEIAERLVLSQRTVDHHISAILEKLGARSRTEASQHAARLGIVAVPKNGHASSLS